MSRREAQHLSRELAERSDALVHSTRFFERTQVDFLRPCESVLGSERDCHVGLRTSYASRNDPVEVIVENVSRDRATEKKMIEPQVGVAAPRVPEVIPEGIDPLVRMECA